MTLRRPPELDRLDLGRSAVIEASAGTGKTYLLEHIVLELVISGRARLDQILVVTFTERATAELVTRIRNKIDQALAIAAATPTARHAATFGWTIDPAARARLVEARHSFDQATIATIHAFCQRILTDEPLATGRLVGQTQVDGRRAFGETFREVLRRTLATDDAHRPYLEATLANRRSVAYLEDLVYKAATARGQWAYAYDEAALEKALRLLIEVDVKTEAAKKAFTVLRTQHHKVVEHFGAAASLARSCLSARRWATFLAFLDDASTFCGYLAKLDDPQPPSLVIPPPLREAAKALLDAAPCLDEAVAQRFAAVVAPEFQQRKLADGLYDFDDMIRAVDETLNGDRGPAVVDKLRGRFRFALLDEAQDIEPSQWNIFRRLFLDSDRDRDNDNDRGGGEDPRPLMLIGDPKQAIYGFRGADVHTYVVARDEILARGGTSLTLSRNHRSHPELVSAYNAVLDHQASERYFGAGDIVAYDHPVVAEKPPLGDGPGATLLRLQSPDGATAVRVGVVRRALLEALVAEIEGLKAATPALPLSEIFVLVRSNAEARHVASRLHAAGIANVLFKPDDIFKSAEATHVRTLLLAIADPTDRARRLSAWLTPFFDVDLTSLSGGAANPPPDHPLMARLLAWKRLADDQAYDTLWPRLIDDSGVARRLRLAPSGLRRLTNYRHVFDLLHLETAARPSSVSDLATLLAAGVRRPNARDEDTQRLETEADAVRVMTMHAAKGLEADIVFIYGGFSSGRPWRGALHTLQKGPLRQICIGRPKRGSTIELIDATRHQEARRLLYVAMTRARKHLYLPFFPLMSAGEVERDKCDFDLFERVSGDYRHVNQRLRALATDPSATGLFRTVEVPLHRTPTIAEEAEVKDMVTRWTPGAALAEVPPRNATTTTAALRAARRGFVITSYSRLKEASGGYQPPGANDAPPGFDPDFRVPPADAFDVSPMADATGPVADTSTALEGGIASGLFLHAVLEKAALGVIAPLPVWKRQPEVRGLIDRELRRWDRDPRQFDAAAALVHAALTVHIPLPDGTTLPGIARGARVRREVDFLFPLPQTTAAAALLAAHSFGHQGDEDNKKRVVVERGFVRGFLDVIFEHGGRIYFGDWKSDFLPAFDGDTLNAHVDKNYDWQVRLYTLALVRMLGIETAAEHERRFGGLVYVFLRGLAPASASGKEAHQSEGASNDRRSVDGLHVARPSYAQVAAWDAELAALPLTAPFPAAGDER